MEGGKANSSSLNLAASTGESYPQSGHGGHTLWPVCEPGFGNCYSSYEICQRCKSGTYSALTNDEQCQACSNKPDHSDYTEDGQTTADCVYECDPGHVNEDCNTPFEEFINGLGGLQVVVSVMASLICVIIAPLLAYRFMKQGGYFAKKEISTKKLLHRFGNLTTGGDNPTERNYLEDEIVGTTISHLHFQEDNNNNVSSDKFSFGVPDVGEDIEPSHISEIRQSSKLSRRSLSPPKDTVITSRDTRRFRNFKEMRISLKMNYSDLHHHAARIYLWGSNCPFSWTGGPWRLAVYPPVCLKGTIKHKEYKEFAEAINREVTWSEWGWEAVTFFFLSIFTPPYADSYLYKHRKQRAMKLLNSIVWFDQNIFMDPASKHNLNSIRVGMSPDLTMAYLDILFDEVTTSPYYPLCSVGQPKFPLSFRFCGLGTYFSPWHLDTNDVLLHSVSQASSVSDFIDEAWLNFVMSLNLILRKVRREHIKSDLLLLLRHLENQVTLHPLGGLVICFTVFLQSMPIMVDRIDEENGNPLAEQPESTSDDMTNHEDVTRTACNSNDEQLTHLSRFKSDDSEKSDLEQGPDNLILQRHTFGRHSDVSPDCCDVQHSFSEPITTIETGTVDTTTCNIALPMKESPEKVNYHKQRQVIHVDTFDELCRAIYLGQALPGIVVYHKTTPLEEILQEDELIFNCTSDILNDRGNEWGVSKANLRTTEEVNNLRHVYGDKVNEIEKFYNIVQRIETNTQEIKHDEVVKQMYNLRELDESRNSMDSTSLENDKDFVESKLSQEFQRRPQGCSSANLQANCMWRLNTAVDKPVRLINPTTITQSSVFSMWQFIPDYCSFLGLKWFLLFASFSHGLNMTPFRILRLNFQPMYKFMMLFFCIHDVTLFAVVSIYYWCAWGNRTTCKDHTAFYIIMLFWPCAAIMSPISSLIDTILMPHSRRCREHACWTNLNFVSIASMAFIYLLWNSNLEAYIGFLILSLGVANRIHSILIDQYIAVLECTNRSRGWDGLPTSLKKDDDR